MPKARRSTNARPAPTASAIWSFREPIATLLADGKTVGRHYAGPNWEHSDGSAVAAKVAGNAPGATANDIPWLKLEVTSRRGSGVLADVTTVQRINTKGGKRDGACETVGSFLNVPYSADYVFLRNPERRAERARRVCNATRRPSPFRSPTAPHPPWRRRVRRLAPCRAARRRPCRRALPRRP